MRFPTLSHLLVLLCLATVASAAASNANRPFIERVRPVDYHDAEKLFPEQYSSTNELVVLRTAAAKPVSALALKRTPAGEDYTLTIQIASAEAPDGWLKIEENLDASLGQQVLRAFELKLHRQVALSNFKRRVSETDTDLWLYQRLSEGRTAAALITMKVALENPAATTFIDGFIGGFQQLVGTEGEQRAAILQKIDRAATEIILADSP
jgi:hypothetical protein